MDTNKRLDAVLKKLDALYNECYEHGWQAKYYTEESAKLYEEWLLLDKQSKADFWCKIDAESLTSKQMNQAIQLSSAAKSAHDRYERYHKQAELWEELANKSLAESTKLKTLSNEAWIMKDENNLLYEELSKQSSLSSALANEVYEQYDLNNKQAKLWAKDLGKLNKKIAALECKKKALIDEFNQTIGPHLVAPSKPEK